MVPATLRSHARVWRQAAVVVVTLMLFACAPKARPVTVGVDGTPLAATTDPAVIAQGRYLANGPGHCAACHTAEGPLVTFDARNPPALIGGYAVDVPGGKVRTPNLTSDSTTGIGARTDAELVLALRYGRRPGGGVLLPFMDFQGLSDEDLVAVVSYLRSLAPVRNEVQVRDINWFGRLLVKMFVRARRPSSPPPPRSPTGPSVERGEYLSNSVAGCTACHTRRSRTGGYKGARLSGGQRMADELDSSRELVTPNLTPDAETGHIVNWTEEQFVTRFRTGLGIRGSPMPWSFHANMTDADLRSIYRYLMSLAPVRHEVGPIVRTRN